MQPQDPVLRMTTLDKTINYAKGGLVTFVPTMYGFTQHIIMKKWVIEEVYNSFNSLYILCQALCKVLVSYFSNNLYISKN